MRCPGNNCFRVQTQASISECPVHENSGPTGGVFGSILSGEEFRILLVDLAECVLRCALAKSPGEQCRARENLFQGSLWNILEVDEDDFGITFILQILDISECEWF